MRFFICLDAVPYVFICVSLFVYMRFMKKHLFVSRSLFLFEAPLAMHISNTRAFLNQQNKISAPAESPVELRQYVNSRIRSSHAEPWAVWTLPDYSLVTDKVTIVPYTCDYMVGSVAKFANIGISLHNSQSTRVLRLVGDATHDETGQRLKVLRIGVAGCHFAYSEWSTTITPGIDCVVHEETCEAVELALALEVSRS